MWRSNFLLRCSRRVVPLIRNQGYSETPILIQSQSQSQSQSPHLSIFLSQTPRFFSNNSNLNDQYSSFDENPSFFSEEPATPFIDFEENVNFSSQEGVEDQNPSLLSEENAGGDEEMSDAVPEQKVLEEIPEINIEQVESVLSILQSSVEGSIESSLDKLDLNLNEEFMVRVIGTPLVPGDSLIRFFKWATQKSELSTTTRVVDCLVRAVGTGLRKREAYAMWDLLKEIGEEKVLLNTDILNELISLFWKLGKGKAGLEVFNKFEEFGCEPNLNSYYLTIKALCRRSIFDWAWPVCEKMLNLGKLPDSEKIGEIICLFCKGKKAKDAHLVYLMAKEKNKSLPRSCITFLISSLCKEDETVKLASDLLNDFSGDARKYAIKPFTRVIRGLCRVKEIEEAKKLLLKMITEGPPPGNAVFNFVINGYSKAGEMEEAMSLVKVMESRGLKPDVYTYSVIISGYVKGGEMGEAHKVLAEAKKKHAKLCPVTFHTLTRGYCKLEEFDKAVGLLNEMKESGVQPNADEYSKLIQSLCMRALDWRTAEKLLEEMKENGLYVNGNIKGLVRSVKELEEEELGEEVVSIEA